MKKLIYVVAVLVLIAGCKKKTEEQMKTKFISESIIQSTVDSLLAINGDSNKFRIERGVKQVADFWQESDGTIEEFQTFCKNNFINSDKDLKVFFDKMSVNYEAIYGYFNKMGVELKLPIHLDKGEITAIDEMMGAYEPSAHVSEDFFNNKIAFMVALNFPFYSLEEKNKLGPNWNTEQWAYARMGDIYTSRVPANLIQKVAETTTNADIYISEYNIYMGYLVDDKNDTFFSKDLKLISHWNLRDEIKSNYSNPNGLPAQKMIYEVMKRIITQTIPSEVINSKDYLWNPISNKVYKNGKEVTFKAEDNVRYQHLLNNFHAVKAIDAYSPYYPTYIARSFDLGMELTQAEVEKLFTDLCSSPEVKQVAELISKRLGRNLEPFDIWYDGFKARGSIPAETLDKAVRTKYPSKDAFEKDLPNILKKLDFSPDMAAFITSKVSVDASRGPGHAWGAEMKSDKARLRTRIEANGMNYKGYNIAVHEFGHNVEQTISLHNVDYYILKGVPTTAFTEALAFIFQKRDLSLLGIKDNNPEKPYLDALDAFWSVYEIMGVSLVDMNVWKWLYAHPEATAAELKDAVVSIAIDVWNKYYADAFGVKDVPILAIYSHMIDYPLYLSAYPVGHLIDFQIEKQLEGKVFANEVIRMYSQGRLTPQLWMRNAVGMEISIKPMLEATDEALKNLN